MDPMEYEWRKAMAVALGGPADLSKTGPNNANLRSAIGDLSGEQQTPEELAAMKWADANAAPGMKYKGGVVPASVTGQAAPVSASTNMPSQREFVAREMARMGVPPDAIVAKLQQMDRESYAKEKALYDPTSEYPLVNFLAGAGGRLTELGRGTNQLVSGAARAFLPESVVNKVFGTPEEQAATVAEARNLDAPLKGTTAGQFGRLATDMTAMAIPAGGAAGWAAGVAPRVVGSMMGGAAAVPLAGALSGGTMGAIEPRTQGESLLGNIGEGAVGGAIGNVAGAALPAIISPVRATAERVRANRILNQAGVETSAAQATGSPNLRGLEVGLGSVGPIQGTLIAGGPRQGAQYTSAIARELGEVDPSAPLTDAVRRAAAQRVGNVIEDVGNASPYPLVQDVAHRNAIIAVRNDAIDQAMQGGYINSQAATFLRNNPTVAIPERARVAGYDEINAAMRRSVDPAPFTGSGYNTIRSELSAAAKNAETPQTTRVLNGLRDAYDGTAQLAWQEASQLPQAWRQWGIVRSLDKPGVTSELGVVNPQALYRAEAQKGAPFLRGPQSDYGDIVKSGSEVLKPFGGDSGTARNLLIAKALLGGAGALDISRDPSNAFRDLAAGGLGVGTAWMLTQSPIGRRYLANQLMHGPGGRGVTDFLERAGRSYGADWANQ